MKFLSFLFSASLLASSVLGHAFTRPEDALENAHTLEKRAFLPVTGVGSVTQPRLEVRELSRLSNQWTLFLLAMRNLQNRPQTQKTSFYQISGIHGVPRVNWDSVGQCAGCSADGYCPHDSILFLGWHRAYVALLEQEMIKIAKTLASQYPTATRTAMVNAANILRLPFWDWAAAPPNGGNVMPAIMTNPTVTVTGPGGSETFTNPLHHFTFRNPSQLRYTPFTTWTRTLRYPISNAADTTSDLNKAVSALNNIRGNLQDQVYNMFSTCDEFVEVGSDAAGQSSVKCSNSIENIHNTIHTSTGGPRTSTSPGGHMTYLATAAFDPLFWLHHCNVDRLFALWQALYPNSYGGSQVAPHNTWTILKGTTQNSGSPLTPFHKNTAGDFWTTNDVRDTKVFKYTYPEFTRTTGDRAAIVSVVNKLYGPNAAATAGSTKRDAAPEPQEEAASASATSTSTSTSTSSSSTFSASATVDATPLKADNGSLYQYVANIATNRYALGGSYVIYLFDSPPASEAPSSWPLDANLIGPMGVLAQDGMTGAADLVTVGSVPLTRTLTEQVTDGTLPDLSVLNVVPYLIKSLVWRVAGPDGVAVNPDTIPDFEISVWASTATPATEFELPVWSKFIPLAEITKNKAGGATVTSILQPPSAKKVKV